LEASDRDGIDLVVIDDGSSDGTSDAVGRLYPAARVVRLEESAGFTVAANRGLATARGEIVLLLNSDTEVDTGALDVLCRAFDRDPGLGIAGAALRYPGGTPQWSGAEEPTLLWFWLKSSGLASTLARLPLYRRWREGRLSTQVHWVSGAAMAIRRQVLDDVGPFDERFELYAQDLDLCVAARAKGWRVAILPGVGVVHHQGATVTRQSGERVTGRQDLDRMGEDLLRWARKHHGAGWAERAARAMISGMRWRLVARRLASPFVARARRRSWQRERPLYEAAVSRLQGELGRTGNRSRTT